MDILPEKNREENEIVNGNYFNGINNKNLENLIKKKKTKRKSSLIKYYKTDINNSFEKLHKIKTHKSKKMNMHKNYPATSIIKYDKNIYNSLMNIEKDNNPININEFKENKQNITFSIKPNIKQKLLKEYKEIQRLENKYRKIKIISNLYDSLEDNEEASDDEENNGSNCYLSSESKFIFIYDIVLTFFTFYSLIIIPISLARRKYYCEKEAIITMVLNYYTEIIFMIDVLFSFFRSYHYYEYKKVTNNIKIIKHYLRYGFILDFIQAIPSFTISRKICNGKKHFYKYFSKSEIIFSILLIMKFTKIFKVLNIRKNRVIQILYDKISRYYKLEKLINNLI